MVALHARIDALEANAPRPRSQRDDWYKTRSLDELKFLRDSLHRKQRLGEAFEATLSDDERAQWMRLNQSFEDFRNEHTA